MVPVLERDGLEHAEICRATHQPLRIPWGEFQVRDAGIAGMVRVDSEVHSTIQLLVGTYVAKSCFLSKGAAGPDSRAVTAVLHLHLSRTPPFPME
jgi:hypothetical protein